MLKSKNLQHYLNTEPTKGIIRIYNLESDKSLLIKSNNIIEDSKNIRFQLDLGFYNNINLQQEYAKIGLELFAIEPILFVEDGESLDDLYDKAKKILDEKNVTYY
jgi:hypothetical protein